MQLSKRTIPQATIEVVARSLFKETLNYGFRHVDYLKFVNLLLDMTMKHKEMTPVESNSDIIINNTHQNLDLPLAGKKINIRKLLFSEDKRLLEKWITDESGRYFLLYRITARETNIKKLIKSKRNIVGMITSKDMTPIGILAFLDYDKFQRKAELRKLIGNPHYRGKGLAKEATALWIQYGLSNLGLKKIHLNTLDTNVRNIRINEELGFKVEGILRNEFYFDNKYHDILKMGFWNG